MRTIDAVRDFALSLPETSERPKWGNPTWHVGDKMFAWPRELSKTDIAQWTEDRSLPKGDLVAVRVDDMEEKEALLGSGVPGVFTIRHFRSFPLVLIELRLAKAATVRELVVDAWLAAAPKKIAAAHRDEVLRRAPVRRSPG